MNIGHRIKEVRKEDHHLTLIQFCSQIGITNSALSQIERGKINPSDQTILLICDRYNVNEEWLRTGKGEKYVKKDVEEEMRTAVEKLLTGEAPEMRLRLVKALAGLDDKQLWIVEAKLWEILTGEILTPETMKERIQKYDEQKTASVQTGANFYRLPQDMTPQELHAELDRQLADEKGQADASGASGFGNSGTAAG